MNRRDFFKKTAKCVIPSLAELGLSSGLSKYGVSVASAANDCGGSCSGKCSKSCADDCSGGSYWSAE